ncbi:MAG: hypothetical protein ACREGI_02755 [Candidatus Levyibacteriota bacterium]
MQSIRLRMLLFIVGFIIVFFFVHFFNLLPTSLLSQNNSTVPWLFYAISLIFSIISGFVIQSKWQTWNELIDATHGELSSFRQLHILSHHFSKQIQEKIKNNICNYLSVMIAESKVNPDLNIRSEAVEAVIYQLEETVFDIDYSQHPNIGEMAFDLMRKCMDYREKRLQNISHKLPLGVKVFVIFATFFMVSSPLFIGVQTLYLDFLFTLIIALLSFGLYLLIDDLDHPYRPGQWHLKIDDYKELLEEIRKDTIINSLKKIS